MNAQLSLVSALGIHAKNQPEKVAFFLVSDNNKEALKQITYAELYQRATAIAHILQQNGIRPGERALLLCAPGFDFIAGFLGCLCAGVIAIPAYPPQTAGLADKLQHFINSSQPACCLITKEILNHIQKIRVIQKLDHLPFIHHFIAKLTDQNTVDILNNECWNMACLNKLLIIDQIPAISASFSKEEHFNIKPDDLAFLQYTSGTTYHPKGVMVTHGNIVANVEVIASQIKLTEQHKLVSWLPPYHDMGLIGSILLPIYKQIPAYLMAPLIFLKHPLVWLQTISTYKATTVGAPNFAYELCVNKIKEEDCQNLDLSSWTHCLNGAETIRATTIKKFNQKFISYGFNQKAFIPCYGLAESTLMVSSTLPAVGVKTLRIQREPLKSGKIVETKDIKDSQVLVSSGHICSDYQLYIVDKDSKIVCPDQQVGEIWLAGPCVTKGYWQSADATQETFQAYLSTGEGPFLRTGDLGFMKDNELFITGRLKDLIIINGRNYYPYDIELSIESLSDLIKPGCVAVCAIEHQHEEKAIALVELNQPINMAEAKTLFSMIASHVMHEHGIGLFDIMLLPKKTIKKTTSGKIRRKIMANLYEQNKIIALYQQLKKEIQ